MLSQLHGMRTPQESADPAEWKGLLAEPLVAGMVYGIFGKFGGQPYYILRSLPLSLPSQARGQGAR